MSQNPPIESRTQDWDPFDPKALRDPLAIHAELRERCPVASSNRANGFWALFKYEDIVAAARDTKTFSNALTTKTPLRRQIPLESDPPEHTAYRRFLQTYFGPARLEKLDPIVRRIASNLLDPLLERGHGDFTPEIAYPLPARTVCAFLNQPDDDWLEIRRARSAVRVRAFDRSIAQIAPPGPSGGPGHRSPQGRDRWETSG
ncbi:MAG: hypothetical protein LC797_06025 [Chloroflexi bacterium]|nr:hypothetical protein [Chloroflexota bacterium]